jgi:hypothetical protein
MHSYQATTAGIDVKRSFPDCDDVRRSWGENGTSPLTLESRRYRLNPLLFPTSGLNDGLLGQAADHKSDQ